MDVVNTIGRRKTSVARIYMKSGKGEFTVNNTSLEKYFPTEILRVVVKQPLTKVESAGDFDIDINVNGGGFKGQAEAVRLAIARALCEVNPEFRGPLKSEGFLTRDPRMVETFRRRLRTLR